MDAHKNWRERDQGERAERLSKARAVAERSDDALRAARGELEQRLEAVEEQVQQSSARLDTASDRALHVAGVLGGVAAGAYMTLGVSDAPWLLVVIAMGAAAYFSACAMVGLLAPLNIFHGPLVRTFGILQTEAMAEQLASLTLARRELRRAQRRAARARQELRFARAWQLPTSDGELSLVAEGGEVALVGAGSVGAVAVVSVGT